MWWGDAWHNIMTQHHDTWHMKRNGPGSLKFFKSREAGQTLTGVSVRGQSRKRNGGARTKSDLFVRPLHAGTCATVWHVRVRCTMYVYGKEEWEVRGLSALLLSSWFSPLMKGGRRRTMIELFSVQWNDSYMAWCICEQAASSQCSMWFTILLMESGKRKAELVLYGMVWYGMVWYGMVWYGMVQKHVLRWKENGKQKFKDSEVKRKCTVRCTMYNVRCCTMYDAMQCNVHVPSDEHLNLLRRGRKAASNRARSYVGWWWGTTGPYV